jgi:hypothetical protein
MPLTRAGVEFLRNAITLSLSQIFHARAFRYVLTNQPIGVFVCAPFPGVIWVCEKEFRSCRFFNFWILVKLGSVIRSNRPE